MLKYYNRILLVFALSCTCQQVQANFGSESKLTPSIDQLKDAYGYSIDIDGDIAIVGAYRNDDNGVNSGAAYIFVRDTATGTWSEEQKIVPADIAEGDNFGISVSVSAMPQAGLFNKNSSHRMLIHLMGLEAQYRLTTTL